MTDHPTVKSHQLPLDSFNVLEQLSKFWRNYISWKGRRPIALFTEGYKHNICNVIENSHSMPLEGIYSEMLSAMLNVIMNEYVQSV